MSEEACCKHCGSRNVYGMSRVVGFFSKIDDWNNSKRAEFKHRQEGNYSVKKSLKLGKECEENADTKVGVKC